LPFRADRVERLQQQLARAGPCRKNMVRVTRRRSTCLACGFLVPPKSSNLPAQMVTRLGFGTQHPRPSARQPISEKSGAGAASIFRATTLGDPSPEMGFPGSRHRGLALLRARIPVNAFRCCRGAS
jgi:hypothetical protein